MLNKFKIRLRQLGGLCSLGGGLGLIWTWIDPSKTKFTLFVAMAVIGFISIAISVAMDDLHDRYDD